MGLGVGSKPKLGSLLRGEILNPTYLRFPALGGPPLLLTSATTRFPLAARW
jgi:hypothetical protein